MLQSRQLHGMRGVVVQRGGGGAGARAVDEAEGGVEADIVDELHHFLEIVVRFTGEADDEVARQHHVWANRAQFADGAFVFQRGVAAFHGAQNAVGAVLHRQMQVVDQLRQAVRRRRSGSG